MLRTGFAIFIFLIPYTLSLGESNPSFTLSNGTRYFLHCRINGAAYLYVGPGGRVVYSNVGPGGAIVDVSYSPGQGIIGTASRTFAVEYTNSTSGSGSCSSTRSGSTCTSTTEATSSIVPLVWNVQASDLQPN